MAECNEVRGLLGSNNKYHRRYGSTSVNMKKPEHLVCHRVKKEDTIQGIALRYGISVELLKTYNKLWSSQSVFLRDFLEIPVSQSVYESILKSDPLSVIQPHNPSSPTLTNGSTTSSCSQDSTNTSTSNSPKSERTASKASCMSPSICDCSEKSSEELLAKIDSNIAQMKSHIEKQDSTYTVISQMEIDDSHRKTKSSKRQEANRHPRAWDGWQDAATPPRTIVTNPSRTITMSLKRLLRDHDELYQL